MQIIRSIDLFVSFLCACLAWQIMFGDQMPVQSAIMSILAMPVMGFFGVVLDIFKIASFIVVFLSSMFVFEQIILIARAIGDDYSNKMGPVYKEVAPLEHFDDMPDYEGNKIDESPKSEE